MRSLAPVTLQTRSIIRRALLGSALVAFAALVAAGCGSGDSDGSGSSGDPGRSGIVASDGPLAWLPADTWLVASANLDPKAIDTAVKSLDRLPIWALAEGFLPASDGAGLRKQLLEQVAKESASDGGKPKVTAKELEAAFGNRAGMAITSTDFDSFDSDTPPIAVWVEVDDADKAEAALVAATKGSDKEASHEGVDYRYSVSKSDEFAFAIEDGLAVVAPSRKQLERLIDVHEGKDSLADDEQGRAVIEGGIGDALGGVAVQSAPLLDAVPDLVKTAAKEADDPADRAKAEKIAEELGPLLKAKSVDELVPDWMSASLTIDDSGLRIRGAWSDPHELASPEPGTRELVEQAPADSNVVAATATSGKELGRIQDAWTDVRDAYDLDLRKTIADECETDKQWACTLGAELVLTVLEDRDLADASEETGDTAVLLTEDIGGLIIGAVSAGETGKVPTPTTRFIEYAMSTKSIEDSAKWKPNEKLVDAMEAAGLVITYDATSVTIKVTPGSPLAAELAKAGPELAPALGIYGIDAKQLLTTGVTFSGEEVGDLTVFGLPQAAPSKLGPALDGKADQLGKDDDYERVVKAAKVPDEVGQFGYLDLAGTTEQVLTALAKTSPNVSRAIPTVRNNLEDVPGLVWWTARDEVKGEKVGTWELALPILE